MKNNAIKLLGFLVILLVGCTATRSTIQEKTILADQFAFVEFYVSTDGKALKGTPPVGKRIDSPAYSFDSETKTIHSNRTFNFSIDSLSILLGTGRILTGAAGSGVSSILINASELPFAYSSLRIIKVDSDRISAEYDTEKISVDAGQTWSKTIALSDTLHFDGNEVVVEKMTKIRVSYHGLLPKSALKKD